jgi:hypothetical protein
VLNASQFMDAVFRLGKAVVKQKHRDRVSMYTNVMVFNKIKQLIAIYQSQSRRSELLGFWTLSIIQYSKKLEKTTFRKLYLFPSSDEGGRHLLCWVLQKEQTSISGQPMSKVKVTLRSVYVERRYPKTMQ